MSVLRRLTLLTLPLLATACGAEETSTTPAIAPAQAAEVSYDSQALQTRFAKLGLNVLDIRDSDMPGLVEIQTQGGVLFATPNGSHFLAGTLYELNEDGSYKDVIAARQAPINAEKIAQMEDSMIVFKAPNEKHVVTVFTDTTCGYCVKLHNEMQDYNDLGITVRYLAYPRQGATGPVAKQMATIWCADDKQAAMHDAKVERKFGQVEDSKLAQCQATIAEHYQLGRELGISGTPAIFLPNGELVGGYVPAAQLLQRLEQQ